MHISIWIPGKPVPKQSFHYTKHGGGYTDERVKHWQSVVAYEVMRRYTGQPVEYPLHVIMEFWLPDNRKRDLDNLSKAVLDALNGILWVDDRQVNHLILVKQVRPNNTGVKLQVW